LAVAVGLQLHGAVELKICGEFAGAVAEADVGETHAVCAEIVGTVEIQGEEIIFFTFAAVVGDLGGKLVAEAVGEGLAFATAGGADIGGAEVVPVHITALFINAFEDIVGVVAEIGHISP